MVTSWADGKQDTLKLFVEPRRGLTRELLRQAETDWESGIANSRLILFSGPNGISAAVGDYGNVIVIADGFGIDQHPSDTKMALTEFRTPINTKVDTQFFPDGIKTTGQQAPLYDILRPYSDFPRNITGNTVWEAEDYTGENERLWKRHVTQEEIDELSAVSNRLLASGWPLTGMSKVWVNPL